MRIYKSALMVAALLIGAAAFASSASNAAETTSPDGIINLNGNSWRFHEGGSSNWLSATVPGTVHTDLMAAGRLDDPYFELNERKAQWVDKTDWVYERSFTIDKEVLGADRAELCFDGLDTYADVRLNGEVILRSDNMFCGFRIDVTERLVEGENTLNIYFHSPIKRGIALHDALPFDYEACNDQSQAGGLFDKRVSIYTRKAGYHYGWDWGPRLVTSGIWRDVRLEYWSGARIADVYYRQDKISAQKAEICAVVCVDATSAAEAAKISISADGRKVASLSTSLEKGLNTIEVPLEIAKPRLWWPRGHGEQYRYEFKAEVAAGSISCTRSDKIGLRSIELVREDVADGRTFYFKVNGRPIFMKGANYIPCDVFLPRVTHEIYDQTIADAASVNMNMLRVWGGGVYEDDYFYELCDREGILIWQDFMFACSLYPASGRLMESIKEEAAYNITRLRNRACIALWCGNNECHDAFFGWGWLTKYAKQGHPEWDKIIYDEFVDLYHNVLPSAVEQYSPGTAYTPSSPYAEFGVPSIPEKGDMHNWQVWHGNAPFAAYATQRSRFFSEYGFQSFPGIESIKLFAPNRDDWHIDSDVLMCHQRGGSFANMRIAQYMESEYWKPENFEDFIYMSSLIQGDAVVEAIEAHRRDMGYCWGTLFWQHNDCWPVASWASRDWYGVWKAQHYFARKAFDDILVSAVCKEGVASVHIISDRHRATRGTLKVDVMDLNGKVLFTSTKKVSVPAGSSILATKVSCPGETSSCLVSCTFTCDRVYREVTTFELLKDMKLPQAKLQVDVAECEGGYEVTVRSDSFARAIWLTLDGVSHHFSDNYFDLLPGESRTVTVQTGLSREDFLNQLRVRHIAQTR